jgi:predicted acyltransferase
MLISKPQRLLSLDAFRGLVIAGMILVTDPGTYSHVYPQLRHAEWNGATATDMVFPAFLFMVGIAIPFSISTRAQHQSRVKLSLGILRRSLILILLGLAINGFPFYHWQTLRLPGILQRIALCYLFSALLFLFSKRSSLFAAVGFFALALYWVLLKTVSVPDIGAGHLDSFGNLPAYIDRAVFTIPHLWPWGLTPGRGVTYDPEGLLSTVPALFSTLLGVITGNYLRDPKPDSRRKAITLLLTGMALTISGLALSPLFPINKRIWTPTFSLFSTGICLSAFAVLYFLIDTQRIRRGLTPFLILGTNAVLAFTVSSIITSLLGLEFVQQGIPQTAHGWVNDHVLAPHFPANLASLAFAVFVVACNIAFIFPFYRKRIFLRIA